MLHSRESLWQKLSIDIKYIDIAQWAKMCNTLDFSKSEIIAHRSCTLLAIFQ